MDKTSDFTKIVSKLTLSQALRFIGFLSGWMYNNASFWEGVEQWLTSEGIEWK